MQGVNYLFLLFFHTYLSLLTDVLLAPSDSVVHRKLKTSKRHIAPARKRMRFAFVNIIMVRRLHHFPSESLAICNSIFTLVASFSTFNTQITNVCCSIPCPPTWHQLIAYRVTLAAFTSWAPISKFLNNNKSLIILTPECSFLLTKSILLV